MPRADRALRPNVRLPKAAMRDVCYVHRDVFERVSRRVSLKLFHEVLLENLERLVAQGYGPVDLAVMYGVTKVRVRQWLVRWKLMRPWMESGPLARKWDARLGHFIGVTPDEYVAHLRALTAKAQRRTMVRAVRDLSVQLGRAPFNEEVAAMLDLRLSVIARLWDPHLRRKGRGPSACQKGLNRLCRAARTRTLPATP